MVEDIKKYGLIKGMTPRNALRKGEVEFITSTQWLTAEPNPGAQSWATSEYITYSRTAYRVTVEIPVKFSQKKLYRGIDFARAIKNPELVTKYAGSKKWFVYHGNIPKIWITKVEKLEEKPDGRI
jgi:hypothetical protein